MAGKHVAGTTVMVTLADGTEYGYRMGPGLQWTVVADGQDAGTYPTRREALAACGMLVGALDNTRTNGARFSVPYDRRG